MIHRPEVWLSAATAGALASRAMSKVQAAIAPSAQSEIRNGERFAFGRNWSRFLASLTAERVASAEASQRALLLDTDLRNKRFLDIGSGSGLFSLAAHRQGAAVVSFDYDPDSVACTRYLRQTYAPESDWQIFQGSVLDADFVAGLGEFDVVYSWGVLHHTGDMWRAIAQAAQCCRRGGLLAIAIYNDQGGPSRRWRAIKRCYVRSSKPVRALLICAAWFLLDAKPAAYGLLRGRWTNPQQQRGMSRWHDLVDWVGGYPFEVATPEAVFHFLRSRGFQLQNLVTRQGIGCNEFVFQRNG